MYQYLINLEDSMMESYLKLFTFLTKEEIENIMKEHNAKPELRIAQKKLAQEIITDIHGKEEYESALKVSEALFKGNIKNLNKEQLIQAFNDVPSFSITEELNLVDFLNNNKIVSSKREARELINNKAISVNGDIVDDLEYVITKEKALCGEFIIIRKGKKKYYLGNYK